MTLLVVVQIEASITAGAVDRVVADPTVERALMAEFIGVHVILKLARGAVVLG